MPVSKNLPHQQGSLSNSKLIDHIWQIFQYQTIFLRDMEERRIQQV